MKGKATSLYNYTANMAQTMVVSGYIGGVVRDADDNIIEDNTAQGLMARFSALLSTAPSVVYVVFRACWGGSIYDGIPMGNEMLRAINEGVEVVTVDEGIAASMAGFLYLHGSVRQIDELSRWHAHRPKQMVVGTANELKAAADNVASLEVSVIERVALLTGKDAEWIKENWYDGPDHEFGAKYCLEHGIATEIIKSAVVPKAASKIKGDNPEMIAKALMPLMTLTPTKPTEIVMKHTEATKAALNLPADATDEQVDAALAAGQQAKADLATMQKQREDETNAAIEAEVNEAEKRGAFLAGEKANMLAMAKKLGLADTKVMLAKLKPHTPINAQLSHNQNPAATATELATLAAMSYEELDRKGKLPVLKNLDRPTFDAKYKEKWGTDYKGE